MLRITLYGPNLPRGVARNGETFAVHAADCRCNARRALRSVAEQDTFDCALLVALCDAVYPPGEFDCAPGEYMGDFDVKPCASALSD